MHRIIILLCLTAILFGGLYFLYTSALRLEPMKAETLRKSSPNNLIDCILIESDTGTVTSTDYLIYIKPFGEKVGKDDKIVFGAQRLRGDNIYWKDANTLRIEYENARIFSFTNYCTLQINGKDREINIEEVSLKNH